MHIFVLSYAGQNVCACLNYVEQNVHMFVLLYARQKVHVFVLSNAGQYVHVFVLS